MKNQPIRGQTGNIGFVFLPDSTLTTGAGKTGLTNASAGLNISVRRELSAAATAYTGANIGTITTLGTWADPTAGKVNFKEVDSTNLPGLYEVHFENAKFGNSDASRKLIGMVQATGVAPTPFEIHFDGHLPLATGSVNDAGATATAFIVASNDLSISNAADWVDKAILFVSGALRSRAAHCTSFNTGTHQASFTAGYEAAPANGDAFIVIGQLG